uniref:Lysophospholipase n=1 Tax=Bionectria ochroleuca TaxID=29856 RepID=A0A8H7N417_BIOOC
MPPPSPTSASPCPGRVPRPHERRWLPLRRRQPQQPGRRHQRPAPVRHLPGRAVRRRLARRLHLRQQLLHRPGPAAGEQGQRVVAVRPQHLPRAGQERERDAQHGRLLGRHREPGAEEEGGLAHVHHRLLGPRPVVPAHRGTGRRAGVHVLLHRRHPGLQGCADAVPRPRGRRQGPRGDGRLPQRYGLRVQPLRARVLGPHDVRVRPLEWIASNFTNGTIGDKGKCVRGYDQFGFVMGTSSSLFNQFLLQNITAKGESFGLSSAIINVIEKILQNLSSGEDDIAQYNPNPFQGWNPTSGNPTANDDDLTLVDGGEDLQNIPLHPLIQPYRAVDIIFAVDSSADTTYSWPNGTALRATYDRSSTSISNGTLFPAIPSAETFINSGLNRRPTLFGCDPSNFTLSPARPCPLVFYIPNAPYSTLSNVSTFDPQYTIPERDAIIRNGLNAATQGNATVDKDWSRCVGCAVLSRSWWKAGEAAPSACQACFDRYCWDGKENNTAIRGEYEPAFIVAQDFNASQTGGDDDSAAGRRRGLGGRLRRGRLGLLG